MGKVSSRFTVTAIHDGSAVNAIMRCDTTLSQMVSQSGACIPDWSQDNPTIWVQTDLAGVPKPPTPASIVWMYNGNAITFDEDNENKSTGTGFVDNQGNPLFQKTTKRVGGIDFPALKILRNLGSAGNTDNDVIACSGSVEDNGYPLGFTVSLPVRMSTMTGSGFIGQITGEQAVTTASPSVILKAKLYNGTESVTTFWTKWYDEADGSQIGQMIASNAQGVAQLTINASQITDYIVLRCDFFEKQTDTSPCCSAFWEVDDETDPERMYISNSATGNGVNNKSGAFLRQGQSVAFTAWMGSNTSSVAIDNRYQYFYCRLYDHKNEVLTQGGSGTPMGTKALTPSGLFDITANDIAVPGLQDSVKGGRVSVTYDYLNEKAGGDLSGIIIASDTTITT